MKNNRGITVIALIITIIITIILATIVIKYGTAEISKAKIEDLKATMLLIKGRAQISIDKANFEKDYEEIGVIKLELENDVLSLPETATEEYDLSSLQSTLNSLENKDELYIWEQAAMDNNNINVEITDKDFFVIDYNTMEVYSSVGYEAEDETLYSLTQLQEV